MEFLKRYNEDVKMTKVVMFENTGLYFIVGFLVPVMGYIYDHFYPSFFQTAVIVLYVLLILTAIFEVDFMFWLHLEKLGWKYWKTVPAKVAKREGRAMVAAGMYQATLFFTVGLLISYILIL